MNFERYAIAVVVPAYRVERTIERVIADLPAYVQRIIIVDDASPDSSAERVAELSQKDQRLVLIRHPHNQGVGAAMLSGFRKALELGAQIVVKVDGDHQMDASQIPALIAPLIQGKADYVKGNRFRDFAALQTMPLTRRIGNLGLSFLTKAASGYWNLFDPTNGFFAIRAEALAQLPFEKIDPRYFFETSMLANLYLINACALDTPIPARYGAEVSHLSIRRTLFEFPLKLLRVFLRRILLKYYIYDFSIASLYIAIGTPLFLFGLGFGAIKWIQYASQNIPAPTGTVMLPTLCVILGIQLLLSAIEFDIKNTPKEPLGKPL
ncbi:MAG: glycosyltransferase family 2 protein [Anaerolineales bacterium]|nr:glycosyltransferase family 2 protein [Anaerolineales bacterium]